MRDEESKFGILCVCTSCEDSPWGSITGLWLDELVIPYYAFKDAGYDVDICSVKGGRPAIDPASFNDATNMEERQLFMQDEAIQRKVESARSVEDVLNCDNRSKYACILLCGGHGCMSDFKDNVELCSLVEYVYSVTQGCVAAICHGPIGLLRCHHNGKPLLKDKFIAAFSNEEESLLGLDSVLPFLVETLMDEVGAVCVPSSPWNPNAVVDGRLVTGQNPQSSLEVAHRVLDVLRSLGPKFSPPENANKPWGS
eukprot:gene12221-25657_t